MNGHVITDEQLEILDKLQIALDKRPNLDLKNLYDNGFRRGFEAGYLEAAGFYTSAREDEA